LTEIDPRAVRRRAFIALLAASALNIPFGTIYAFSVFLRPMEQQLGVSRTEMSVVFASATVALAVGMNLLPPLARRFHGAALIAAAGLIGAIGIALVTQAQGFWLLFVGYGVLFGLGGGLSFTAVQQCVNQAMPRPSGLANGYVVSTYPIGAMIGAPVFSATLHLWGIVPTLWLLAGTLGLAGLTGGWLYHRAGLTLVSRAATQSPPTPVALTDPGFVRLFAVFFLAASAGLMVLGQAAAMLHAYGASSAMAAAATTVITAVLAASRLMGGWLVDHWQMRTVALSANLCAFVGAVLITVWPSPVSALLALSMLAGGYGLMSGSSAGYIPRVWPRDLFATLAARLYVAWCLAAVCLPVLAGWLFDLTGGYRAAVMVAAVGNLLGAWFARRIVLTTANA
jgi:OFA family oxalate/formate antiporter-like MFS transporter